MGSHNSIIAGKPSYPFRGSKHPTFTAFVAQAATPNAPLTRPTPKTSICALTLPVTRLGPVQTRQHNQRWRNQMP
jgi:hypothetical protein